MTPKPLPLPVDPGDRAAYLVNVAEALRRGMSLEAAAGAYAGAAREWSLVDEGWRAEMRKATEAGNEASDGERDRESIVHGSGSENGAKGGEQPWHKSDLGLHRQGDIAGGMAIPAEDDKGPSDTVAPPVAWADVKAASAALPSLAPKAAPEVRSKRASEATDDGAPDWEAFRDEAEAKHGPGMIGLFLLQDERLSARGFHPASPFWKWSLGDYYQSGKRWGVWMVGRGGAKSTTLTRVSGVETLFGERVIPPGQTWLWPYISVVKPDARRRLNEIQAILLHAYAIVSEIGFPDGVATLPAPDKSGPGFKDSRGNSVAFVSLASTIAGVSGPSTIGTIIDEEAKLRDVSTGANPAAEIIRSIRQTFRSREGIRGFRCSSAWLKSGSHYEAIRAGHTDLNYVANIGAPFINDVHAAYERLIRAERDGEAARLIREHAATLTAASPNIPTFLANPSQSAEATRAEEPDVMVWLREACSFPMGGEGGTWDTLADLDFRREEVHAGAIVDLVVALAPSADGSEWGIVAAGLRGGGIVVTDDASGSFDGHTAIGRALALTNRRRASVIVVAAGHADRVRAELAGAMARGTYVPALAPVDVYDGPRLRLGPLRSQYLGGRLAHAAGLNGLELAARQWTAEAPRSPRLEALAAAVKRLVDCYPWAAPEPEAMRGPGATGSHLDRAGDARSMLERLGARIGRDGMV